MITLRTAAQQALEALEAFLSDELRPHEAAKISAALKAALAQQADPLNLRDPAVQKRLATQWGYVPAAQAEPVEDVLLSAAGLALDALEHDRQAAARSGRSISMLSSRAIEELRGALRAALVAAAEREACAALLEANGMQCG